MDIMAEDRRRIEEVQSVLTVEGYSVEDVIDFNRYDEIFRGEHLLTSQKVCIKAFDKSMRDDLHLVYQGIEAMKALNHQHVCKLYQVIEKESKIFIVIEYCPDEVYNMFAKADIRYQRSGPLPEYAARMFFRQMVAAVAYLHSQGIVYLELNSCNFILGDDNRIRLIGFGANIKPEYGMTSLLDVYDSDDVLAKCAAADIWSLGEMLHHLLCGEPLFINDWTNPLESGVNEKPGHLSVPSIEILDQLLEVDPQKRITIDKLLVHPWMTQDKDGHPGYAIPWESIYHARELDDKVVHEMAVSVKKPYEVLYKSLSKWAYDRDTATYLLMWKRNQKLVQLSQQESVYIFQSPPESPVTSPPQSPVTNRRCIGSGFPISVVLEEKAQDSHFVTLAPEAATVLEASTSVGRSMTSDRRLTAASSSRPSGAGVSAAISKLGFPSTRVGSTSSQKISFQNWTNANQEVLVQRIIGPFTLRQSQFTILSGYYARLPIQFQPVKTGLHMGSLLLDVGHSGETLSISLQGEAY